MKTEKRHCKVLWVPGRNQTQAKAHGENSVRRTKNSPTCLSGKEHNVIKSQQIQIKYFYKFGSEYFLPCHNNHLAASQIHLVISLRGRSPRPGTTWLDNNKNVMKTSKCTFYFFLGFVWILILLISLIILLQPCESQFGFGVTLCGLCRISPCLCGFSPKSKDMQIGVRLNRIS